MNPSDRYVHIVAADLLARGGLAAVLSAAPGWEVVAQTDPQTTLSTLTALHIDGQTELPDVILWDLGWLPTESLTWLRTIMQEFPALPIVALVESADAAGPVWSAGVRGLLPRAATLEQLIAALHATYAGLRVLGPELLPPRVGEYSPDASESEQIVAPLTPREMDVLQLLAQGLPNKSIARELAVSEHTVKFHMNSILSKLNAQSRTEAVVNAGRAGIIQV